MGHRRGKRAVKGAFGIVTRKESNSLGYDTITVSGNHTNTLRRINNDGPISEGDLTLVDAGIEIDSLYTTDITHTLPVNDRSTKIQACVHQATLGVCEAAFARANEPGTRFRDIHDAAMFVIATYPCEWSLLSVSVEESLSPVGQQHRRWIPHGTGHHFGLDVHDCAQVRREMYQDALLELGITFTIEPGPCFRADDEAVPAEYRGTGARIEDSVVVNEDGSVIRISEDIPRTTDDVEAWIIRAQGR